MKNSEKIKEELAKKKQEYLAAARAEFHEGFKVLFEKYPELKSIGWTNFAPYFNDGDECIFSAHIEEPYINGCLDGYDDGDDEDDDGDNLYTNSREEIYSRSEGKYIPNPNYNARNGEIVNAVRNHLSAFDDDIYRDICGNHTEATVTKDGLTISEYTHHD